MRKLVHFIKVSYGINNCRPMPSTPPKEVPVYDDFVLKPERKNVMVSMFLCMLDISSMMVAFWKSIACVDTY